MREWGTERERMSEKVKRMIENEELREMERERE